MNSFDFLNISQKKGSSGPISIAISYFLRNLLLKTTIPRLVKPNSFNTISIFNMSFLVILNSIFIVDKILLRI